MSAVLGPAGTGSGDTSASTRPRTALGSRPSPSLVHAPLLDGGLYERTAGFRDDVLTGLGDLHCAPVVLSVSTCHVWSSGTRPDLGVPGIVGELGGAQVGGGAVAMQIDQGRGRQQPQPAATTSKRRCSGSVVRLSSSAQGEIVSTATRSAGCWTSSMN
jgi:hypothetical protein